MFAHTSTAGKHLLCDLCEIRNTALLHDMDRVCKLMDHICETHRFTVLQKTTHLFEPQGFSVMYLLAESHFTIHTFPERLYAAVDVYSCREYDDNSVYEKIHAVLHSEFHAEPSLPFVVDRG